jgi:iron complex transport system substrate-binding protein
MTTRWGRSPDITTLILVSGLGAALLTGCGQSDSGPSDTATHTHAVTDSTGTPVTIPASVTRIADAWPAHNEIVHMLGGGDKIIATSLKASSTPWLYTVDPALNKAQTVFTTTVNIEALTATRPDVLFVSDPTQFAAKTTGIGIPTLQLIFQTFDGLKKVVATTADVLGPAAQAQAQRYNSYLDTKLAALSAVTSRIPAAARPSVLHISSLNPLIIDGTNSIIDAWITTAGGRNAAQVSGNLRPVSTEQVAQWNPDVIVLGSNAGGAADTGAQTLQKLSTDPFWSRLTAVRNHRAYLNPTGAFLWDRYGIEEALQIQWAAKTLHPEDFTALDMVAETRSFYSQFLHYQLTDDQARRILAAQNPL